MRLNLESTAHPLIMGILNATPDSFSDGGKYRSIEAALAQTRRMIEDGADIIDIGGESTRPGADPVSNEEQLLRILPIIQAVRAEFPDIPISVDTSSAKVAEAALAAKADMINDVSAGLKDPEIFSLAVRQNVPVVLMHCQGTPKTMQDKPYYANVLEEVCRFLQARINAAIAAGMNKENIIIDPGIGFGKRKQDNLELLANLDNIVKLGYPVLLGTSRKRFMGNLCAVDNPEELVTATAVTTALGVMSGVRLFRVHDVKANAQAAQVAWAIKNNRSL